MQEKDLIEKHLENYEDVFRDVINVLLFEGREVLRGEVLEQSVTQSYYSLEGHIHGQDRDIAKYWLSGKFRVAFLGIENQTRIDRYMPMRVMGYDGAVYRGQLAGKGKKKCYPVITLVLYFGYEKRWKKNIYLHECFDIPKGLVPYVNDYKINLFEIAFLSALESKTVWISVFNFASKSEPYNVWSLMLFGLMMISFKSLVAVNCIMIS
jgi:hypothetical protein